MYLHGVKLFRHLSVETKQVNATVSDYIMSNLKVTSVSSQDFYACFESSRMQVASP